MAARLKSITGRIPWSLVSRAAAIAAASLLLPSGWFAVFTVALYLVPLFRPFEFFTPFVALLIFSELLPQTPLTAAFFGVSFYLLLGIKDLVLIDRESAYRTLALLLLLAAELEFFSRFGGGVHPWSAFAASALAAFFFLLARRIARFRGSGEEDAGFSGSHAAVVSMLSALLVFELAWTLSLLPMNVLSQTALLILLSSVLLEFIADDARGRLTRRGILAQASLFLVFAVTILALNRWEL